VNIDAPEEDHYQTVWEPSSEKETLSLEDSGIQSIVWCIGFQPDYRWIDVPIFNGAGYPQHTRGVTEKDGLYFLGLPWQHTWGSARFSGIAQDAHYTGDAIVEMNKAQKPAIKKCV